MSPIYFRLKSLFHSRENTILGRQRLVLFESIAVLSIVLSCASYFVLPTTPLLIGMNIFSILGSIVLLLLYNIRQLTIRWSCTILYVLLQLVLSVKKVSYATSGSPLTDEMILYASFLSLLLITVSIVSYLKYSPTILSVLSILTFSFCIIIAPDRTLLNFMPVYMTVLVGVILYDLLAARPIAHAESESMLLRNEFYEFMHATGLTMEDLRSITLLARNNADKTEKTRNLLALMDARARKNIVGSVLSVKAENESSRELLLKVFPDLTPVQVSICQLILQGRKLSDICVILGKNESNISSQRSRIRAVLGLGPDQNLKEALEERIAIWQEAREYESLYR